MLRFAFAALCLSVAGCSSYNSECEAITDRCGVLAQSPTATTLQKDCDRNARSVWTSAVCLDNLQRCIEACPRPADGG
jgi:hypothetical protein